MQVKDLILEVTRKCNMQCPHCLRGDAQNKTMTREVVSRAFEVFNNVETLVVTGGEPTLAIDTLEIIAQRLEFGFAPEIDNFYMATNGKVIKKRLFDIIGRIIHQCTDNHLTSINISNDDWHDEFMYGTNYRGWNRWINWGEKFVEENWWLFEEARNAYGEDWELIKPKHNTYHKSKPDYSPFRLQAYGETNLLKMGRMDHCKVAKEYSYDYIEIHQNDSYIQVDTELYITVNGDIVLGCDYSYKMMEQKKIASIFDSEETIQEALGVIQIA